MSKSNHIKSLPIKLSKAFGKQLYIIRDNPGKDFIRWEHLRDNMCRRWINLNVMNGLIMSAISTIIFSEYYLPTSAFTFGIISLFSSLIATGFGVGLVYVLGDLKGSRYQEVMEQHEYAFIFALNIPQAWSSLAFISIFLSCAITLWDAINKSPIMKAGISISAILIILHLIGLSYVLGFSFSKSFTSTSTTTSTVTITTGTNPNPNPNPTTAPTNTITTKPHPPPNNSLTLTESKSAPVAINSSTLNNNTTSTSETGVGILEVELGVNFETTLEDINSMTSTFSHHKSNQLPVTVTKPQKAEVEGGPGSEPEVEAEGYITVSLEADSVNVN